jgi:hypothetical protein
VERERSGRRITGRIMILFGLEECPHKSYIDTLKII